MGHIERRQKEKEAIRKSIMDTALQIAVAEGWNAVTIRRIADAIEYTPPIVYEHFKNKEDLFDELKLMGFRMLYKGYDLAIQSESNPLKALLLISENHWNYAFQNRELYQLMFSFDKPVKNYEIEKIIAKTRQLFFEQAQDVELAEELMFNWVCLLNGLIFSIMQMELPPEISTISPKKLFINAIERFLKSI
ncbi:MAG: TetR/AcrR family transcriptional regulator [Prevotellaceae bacterium]|jgi:AcrR family transcriptional regulator|nr:TetR/AcrR family transcriptional regulator [Prevotellaceae bacterium]